MINTAILLSTYNGEKFIEKQLESIFCQTYQDFSVYVRDDGSTDATVEILQKYSRKHNNLFILFEEEPKNRGASSSFLWLLENTNAHYYMFCDQDDVWLENKLEIQMEAVKNTDFENIPAVVFHDLVLTNSQGNIISKSFWDIHNIVIDEIDFESLFVKNIITGCTALINQKMKTEVLKFMNDKIVMYDHLITLIAYSFGKPIPIAKGLILYRDHSNSVTPKLKVKLGFRITNFLANINKKDYLMQNIIQLEEFLEKFQNNLSEKHITSLRQFISLKRMPPIIRFILIKTK